MSASEASIEQRIVQAGVECHRLVQAIHDQLKTDYIREQCSPLHPLAIVKTRMGRFFAFLSGSQDRPKLFANTVLIASFGGLHVMDGIVTYLGLTFAELAEVNPVLNYFAGLLGLGISITVLKLAILAAIIVIFTGRRTIGHRGTAVLALAVMFYSGVVINNVLLLAGL